MFATPQQTLQLISFFLFKHPLSVTFFSFIWYTLHIHFFFCQTSICRTTKSKRKTNYTEIQFKLFTQIAFLYRILKNDTVLSRVWNIKYFIRNR